MRITAILAASENAVIGVNGTLPWRLPDDMAYFKRVTAGHHVVTGRKNYESIPAKFRPLPGRTNVVLTRQDGYEAPGALVASTLEGAIAVAEAAGDDECFIIGGGEIYAEALDKGLVDRIHLTAVHIEISPEGESLTYAPMIERPDWAVVSEERHEADEKHAVPFTFVVLDKKEGTMGPKEFRLECKKCGFAHPKNVAAKAACPQCGEGLYHIKRARRPQAVNIGIISPDSAE